MPLGDSRGGGNGELVPPILRSKDRVYSTDATPGPQDKQARDKKVRESVRDRARSANRRAKGRVHVGALRTRQGPVLRGSCGDSPDPKTQNTRAEAAPMYPKNGATASPVESPPSWRRVREASSERPIVSLENQVGSEDLTRRGEKVATEETKRAFVAPAYAPRGKLLLCEMEKGRSFPGGWGWVGPSAVVYGAGSAVRKRRGREIWGEGGAGGGSVPRQNAVSSPGFPPRARPVGHVRRASGVGMGFDSTMHPPSD